jgi:hypothetical protein
MGRQGGTTFRTATLSIMTLSIMNLTATLSITTLSISIECHYAECHYSECCIFLLSCRTSLSWAPHFLIVMLSAVAPVTSSWVGLLIEESDGPALMVGCSREYYWKGRLCTVDLPSKIALSAWKAKKSLLMQSGARWSTALSLPFSSYSLADAMTTNIQ